VELVPRTTAPSHATGAVDFVPLAAISAAAAFRLREVGDLSTLAGSIARLGQLTPIELRPLPGAGDGPVRYQVVAGFRRLAAVRMLGRTRVLARIHLALDEDDAWALAITQALMAEPLGDAELAALTARLAGTRYAHWAEELIELARAQLPPQDDGGAAEDAATAQATEAAAEPGPAAPTEAATPTPDLAPTPIPAATADATPTEAPIEEPEEITVEQLAEELPARLWMVSQDVSLAIDAWDELPEPLRRSIIEQARYMAELYPYLTRGRR
jgi:hypothetical protein